MAEAQRGRRGHSSTWRLPQESPLPRNSVATPSDVTSGHATSPSGPTSGRPSEGGTKGASALKHSQPFRPRPGDTRSSLEAKRRRGWPKRSEVGGGTRNGAQPLESGTVDLVISMVG